MIAGDVFVEAFCVVVFEFCLRNKRFRRCARQSLLYVRVKRCAQQGVTMVTALTQGELMKAEPLLAKVAQQGGRRSEFRILNFLDLHFESLLMRVASLVGIQQAGVFTHALKQLRSPVVDTELPASMGQHQAGFTSFLGYETEVVVAVAAKAVVWKERAFFDGAK